MAEWFINFCRWARRFSVLLHNPVEFRIKLENRVSREFRDALTICDLKVEPWEVIFASYIAAMFTAIAAFTASLFFVFFMGLGNLALAAIPICCVVSALVVQLLVSGYPKTRARYLRIHSMGDIPEVVSYLVMSMKITPNLEKALSFAAESSDRVFARSIRRLLFDLSLRIHSSIDDAVSSFTELWGQWNDHLKRSIYLLRSSLSERDETARNVTLDRALEVVLDGTRARMDEFAARLHAPTMILYSFFIMIPLALVAMIPAASMVGMEVDSLTLVIVYDLILPIATLLYARSVLARRPAAFSPPKVPDGHPALDRARWRAIVILMLFVGVMVSLPSLPVGPWAEAGPWLGPVPRTIFPLWGIAAAAAIYGLLYIRPLYRLRAETVMIEEEFADSLFIIGRRLTEGRSPEEAFSHLCEAMPESRIAHLFARAHQNVMVLRFNLNDAFFNPQEGAMRDVGSAKVAAVMRLLIQSVERSHSLAGAAITRLADHLKELSDVEMSIRRSLATMTGMIRSTAALFAPLIGGVTLAISQALSGLAAATFNQVGSGLTGVSLFTQQFSVTLIEPEAFVLIIGIYVILLTVILSKFADGIEFGDDRVAFMSDLGMALPAAVAVFSSAAILSGAIFGSLG